eukprot:scaffold558107_cov23-Prasinocladus_malaysianus.AAC.1
MKHTLGANSPLCSRKLRRLPEGRQFTPSLNQQADPPVEAAAGEATCPSGEAVEALNSHQTTLGPATTASPGGHDVASLRQ